MLRYYAMIKYADVGKDNWFDYFQNEVLAMVRLSTETMVTCARDPDDSVSKMCGEMYPQLLEQLKDKLVDSHVKARYDLSAPRVQEEKAKTQAEPPRQRVITRDQLDELGRYMEKRGRRYVKGEVYNLEGLELTQPHRAMLFDSAMMLIALSECLEDRDTAIGRIRDILTRASGRPEGQEINLAVQLSLLETWEENEEDGPLAHVGGVGLDYLFDIDSDSYAGSSEAGRKAVGRWGLDVMEKAWEVYATTKNVFGHRLKIRLL